MTIASGGTESIVDGYKIHKFTGDGTFTVTQGGDVEVLVVAGLVADQIATLTSIGAWEELTITFTPTAAGVVEVTAQAWGGTTCTVWVDDMTITQV